jgi:hypothetical protein
MTRFTHGSLVYNDDINRQRIFPVVTEGGRIRTTAQQAMDIGLAYKMKCTGFRVEKKVTDLY